MCDKEIKQIRLLLSRRSVEVAKLLADIHWVAGTLQGHCSAGTMIFLETERLLFRTHEARDETDFVRMQTDSEVRRYMGGQGWPLEKAQHRFRTQYLDRPKRIYGLWATILKEDDRYIGSCGLRAGGKRGEAHLGYILAKPYWGRGLASEAAKAFINLAFTKLRLSRLLADVEQGHVVSQHILKRFGFKYGGREEIPQSGRVIFWYELTRAAWRL